MHTFTMTAQSNSGPTATRVIILTFRGEFTIDNVSVTTKAGSTQVGRGQLSGPVALVEPTEQQTQQSGGCQ
jgi:hypothetical protein